MRRRQPVAALQSCEARLERVARNPLQFFSGEADGLSDGEVVLDEIQRLCQAYEAADEEGRRLIRLFAENREGSRCARATNSASPSLDSAPGRSETHAEIRSKALTIWREWLGPTGDVSKD